MIPQTTIQRTTATRCLVVGILVGSLAAPTSGVETLVIKGDGTDASTETIRGEILVEARDGGVMLQSDDGQIYIQQPESIVEREGNDLELQPIDAAEMAGRLMDEFPQGFRVFRTTHYVIAHRTSEGYVRRVGGLFEQLYRGFYTYWENQGLDLDPPRFPLVALVFPDRASFLKYAEADIGEMARNLIGYYHLQSNRMVTFNVPNLERNIATIIHEATHQLAYNSGLQTRFADNPMWVSEGLATFFEAPDFRNPRGWRTIGRVNEVNLARWRRYLPRRPEESLTTLLADEKRFRGGGSSESAYAESWALTYFLLKTRREQYAKFMQRLSEGKPLVARSPQERLALIEEVFETTIRELDEDLVSYMRRVR
ncbi:DUF1570 domain-containing protein [Crateriforma conspicua]|uniref:DUF1570 domain-containing protein n=1 Tax=Crateriforma conspicua TaxID=2527996 RepID=A0A5C6FVX3_9PLAN|nr:DUF1570 domain-containing protein [Crateriforma conspicua]TWU66571.1 hypothetical protein V7x_21380 [Crateriforma conspicua]